MENKTKGSGLIFAVILLFVILAMVVTLSSITVLETKMSQKTKSSVGAFYNADSGVEWALNKIANPGGATTPLAVFNGTGITFDQATGKISCPSFGSGSPCDLYLLDQDGKVINSSNTTALPTSDISLVKAVRAVGTQGGETQRAIEAAVAASNLNCVGVEGPLEVKGNDEFTVAQCDTASGYKITGCSCLSGWLICEGSKADIINNRCLAYSEGTVNPLRAEAICCKIN